MSSQVEELIPRYRKGEIPCDGEAEGAEMRSFIDHSKAEDLSERNLGGRNIRCKEDSEVLAVPNHRHREHDEIMEVLEGQMIFYLDSKELVVSAGDPPLFIGRGHIHGFTVIKGELVRFTERTKPTSTFKVYFFQDMFQDGVPGYVMAMRVAYDGDMYISLPGGFKILDYLFITVVGLITKPFVPAKPTSLKRWSQ